jgi:hypothetical protein
MRRPKFIILVLAVLLAALIIFWPGRPPERQDASVPKAPEPPPSPRLSDIGKPATFFHGLTPDKAAPPMDATNLQRAEMLNSPAQSIEEDLGIVAEFVDLYARATGAAPVGDNSDITAALTGTQYPGQKGQLFPRQHNAIRGGQLVDRWGTPLWFHANGPGKLEIRSAGPDKQMFTPDDVAHNPSPPGLGATSEAPPAPN